MARSSSDDPVVPFAFHPLSNGEYAPLPRSAIVSETIRRTLELADVNARRLGITRRQFLRSTCGMATTLTMLAACSREEAASQSTTGPATSGGSTSDPTSSSTARSTSSAPGGTFTLPPESTIDEAAATTVLQGAPGDLIVDV